jgi:VWFA-related protein
VARRLLLPVALLLAASLPSASRPDQAPSNVPPVTAARVAVDLVVRDAQGSLVRDLDPSEVELFEDGIRQEILSLRFVDATRAGRIAEPATAAPPPAAAVGEGAAAGPLGPGDEHPLFLALLFDRLSPPARRAAHDAALEWLRGSTGAKSFVGVYRIDQTLETMVPFTDDRDKARQAVDLLLESTPTPYASRSDRDRLRGLRQTLVALVGDGSPQAAPASVSADSPGLEVTGPFSARVPMNDLDREWAVLSLRGEAATLEALEALERDQQGLATVNSLLALVNGLKTAPGRKAVVFFSEGLLVPGRAAAPFQAVVAEANRDGVTFYAADAAGLRTVSTAEESRRELASIVDELRRQDAVSSGRSMTQVLERNEDILRSDPKGSLARLARETGGVLVSDTNDLASGLRDIQEDLAHYYLLEYAPSNELWDGRFRSIEVRVRRPGVHVQARRGYLAVRTKTPTPVLSQEAPVLAALEMAPGSREVPFHVSVARTPDLPGENALAIAVEVPGEGTSFAEDVKQGRYEQDFTALTLVRDPQGNVLRKLSRRYSSSGPLDQRDEARKGRVLILSETWLPAGRYVVETAVRDAVSSRLGVWRAPLEIPAEQGLRVGSLVLVGHAAKREGDTPEAPSLVLEGLQLYPSTGAPFSRAGGKPIPFFLSCQPAPGGSAPRALVELLKDGTAVFSADAPLKAATGRSTLFGGVPLDGIEPGEYVLRVSVDDGTTHATRSAPATVVP